MADGALKAGIQDRIMVFIQDELLPPGTSIGPADDLLSGGLLDSISVLRLALFVSEEFAFEISPADFLVENFQTVEILAAYVRRASGVSANAG